MNDIISRRKVLTKLGGLGFVTAVPHLIGRALAQSSSEQQILITVYVGGGWDVTGCLDPKPNRPNISAMAGEIERFSGLSIGVHPSRPNVTTFFENHAHNSIVINGLQVRSIAHESCATRLLTGTSSDDQPDIGTLYALSDGQELAIPYFVLGNQAYGGPHEALLARAGMVGQFHRLLGPSQSYEALFGRPSAQFTPQAAEQALIDAYLNERSARTLPPNAKRQIDAFYGARSKANTLGQIFNEATDGGFQLALRSQIDLAITSLVNGATRSILLEHEVDWDTHNQNELRQTVAYNDLFAHLNYLVEQLKTHTLWHKTTIYVASEMSRTPQTNDEEGKDHWPVTSALLVGGALEGGRTIGGTDDNLLPQPTVLNTGTVSSDGVALVPAHVINGILRQLGTPPQMHHPSGGMGIRLS